MNQIAIIGDNKIDQASVFQKVSSVLIIYVVALELVLPFESLRFVVPTSRSLAITMQSASTLNHQLRANLLLIENENDPISNVETQVVEYINLKDETRYISLYRDDILRILLLYLEIVDLANIDLILEEDLVKSNQF